MSAISETYNLGHNIFEIFYFTILFLSLKVKGSEIINNKNGILVIKWYTSNYNKNGICSNKKGIRSYLTSC